MKTRLGAIGVAALFLLATGLPAAFAGSPGGGGGKGGAVAPKVRTRTMDQIRTQDRIHVGEPAGKGGPEAGATERLRERERLRDGSGVEEPAGETGDLLRDRDRDRDRLRLKDGTGPGN